MRFAWQIMGAVPTDSILVCWPVNALPDEPASTRNMQMVYKNAKPIAWYFTSLKDNKVGSDPLIDALACMKCMLCVQCMCVYDVCICVCVCVHVCVCVSMCMCV